MNTEEALKWLEQHAEVNSIRAAVCDLNGIWRGKRVPVAQAEKMLTEGTRMPLSSTSLDVWGADIEENPLVFKEGDADGKCVPTGRGLLPASWVRRPTALVPLWMFQEDDSPSPVDPRQILATMAAKYRKAGLRPVMATELEFYLLDASGARPASAISPVTNRRLEGVSVLSIDDINHFEAFFDDVYKECEIHGIEVDAAISENSAGQFEVNLMHVDDPLRAADDAVFFKRLVKGVAHKYDFTASFMAKPFLDRAGSGLHVHFSILDEAGNNIFDDGTDEGTPALRHAVNGLMESMPESSLIFAPHMNSFRRLQPESHAPTGICWAYENRTAAIRIPGGPNQARRIEHRVAGSDANPYLVLAAILGGAMRGMEQGKEPVDPIEGDAYSMEDLARLPNDWGHGIRLFERGLINRELYPELFIDIFAMAKRQEHSVFAARMGDFEIASYLEVV